MNIGLIGYGKVAKAFIRLLKEKEIECNIKFILKSDGCVFDEMGLDLDSVINFEDNIKEHEAWKEGMTFRYIIDEEIDYLVELTPTNIETGEPALSYIQEALSRGINVITGNKGPIAKDYKNLKAIADINRVFLGIGCTTGAALPSITGGVYDCAGSEIKSVEGILNGTSNYILTSMSKGEKTYKEALEEAIELGIAEKDFSLDVEGYDTALKMVIICNALMGTEIKLKDVQIKGIEDISIDEIKEVNSQGKKIKLIGKTISEEEEIRIKVGPEVVDETSALFSVDNKNKGVHYITDTLGDMVFIGGESSVKNAAASILRDILINERK